MLHKEGTRRHDEGSIVQISSRNKRLTRPSSDGGFGHFHHEPLKYQFLTHNGYADELTQVHMLDK